jgi:hypothetical protein
MAVQCAEVLQFLAKERSLYFGGQATPEDQEMARKALAGVEMAMKSEGLGFVGQCVHDLLVAMLDSVDSKDFDFLRRVADVLESDKLPADPVRAIILDMATLRVRPGQSIFEAVADVPKTEVMDWLKARGFKVSERAVRRAKLELSGSPGRKGRPPKMGQ